MPGLRSAEWSRSQAAGVASEWDQAKVRTWRRPIGQMIIGSSWAHERASVATAMPPSKINTRQAPGTPALNLWFFRAGLFDHQTDFVDSLGLMGGHRRSRAGLTGQAPGIV